MKSYQMSELRGKWAGCSQTAAVKIHGILWFTQKQTGKYVVNLATERRLLEVGEIAAFVGNLQWYVKFWYP